MEQGLVERAGIPFSAIETGQIRGQAPWKMARNLVRMLTGVRQCSAIIRSFRPDAVFMTGGYVAAPVALAAWLQRPRLPLLIYLPDITPGLAIRWTSRLASRVAVSFPEVATHFGSKAVVTGYPVRPELWQADRAAARLTLGLRPELPCLLVFGGSRGSRSINQALLQALPQLEGRCQVVHISGQTDWPQVSAQVAGLPEAWRVWYHVYPYLHEEMVAALSAADLVVTRGGASILGEFPALGLPSILVPYPYAGQHQDANVHFLVSRGAGVMVRDQDLQAQLAPTIIDFLGSPARLAAMAAHARALAQPDAGANIIRELCQWQS